RQRRQHRRLGPEHLGEPPVGEQLGAQIFDGHRRAGGVVPGQHHLAEPARPQHPQPRVPRNTPPRHPNPPPPPPHPPPPAPPSPPPCPPRPDVPPTCRAAGPNGPGTWSPSASNSLHAARDWCPQ